MGSIFLGNSGGFTLLKDLIGAAEGGSEVHLITSWLLEVTRRTCH